jgi:glycosyltransferase involved in cell wall biosynthesis
VRIALNAQLLSFSDTYRSGGISRVIYHLLSELGRDSRGHTFDVFVPTAPTRNGFASGSLQFHATGPTTVRPAVRIAWEQTILPRQLAALKPDLFHGLAYALPVGWSGPSVVTIYDLSFLRFPAAFKPFNRVYLAASARAAARRARLAAERPPRAVPAADAAHEAPRGEPRRAYLRVGAREGADVLQG